MFDGSQPLDDLIKHTNKVLLEILVSLHRGVLSWGETPVYRASRVPSNSSSVHISPVAVYGWEIILLGKWMAFLMRSVIWISSHAMLFVARRFES